jgi:4-alpha-glucanotransferase
LTDLPSTATVEEVVVAAHARLAKAPSMVVIATLDDALRVEERPNLPGTTIERPNWSLALPRPIEELADDPVVSEVAEALQRQGA